MRLRFGRLGAFQIDNLNLPLFFFHALILGMRHLVKEGRRHCWKCKTIKPLTFEFFNHDKYGSGGFHGSCKLCHNLEQRKKRPNPSSEVRLRLSQRSQLRHYQYRTQVLELLGTECSKCRFADRRALQIDHVAGGGYTERKTIPSGSRLHRYILSGKADLKKYQILCANCNWIKKFENNETSKRRVA
jgi:hypothetical protein